MKDSKKGYDKRGTEKMGSNQPAKGTRNVSRLQEKQKKRGRFTEFS